MSITYYRGVSGYQTLGGQVVMWRMVARRRRPVAPSILPKSGWAIAHPAQATTYAPGIYIPYFIISTVALSVGILAVPLYILVKACTTKLCPKSQIPELNTEAQKKINDLEAETLKLNEEIKNIRKNLIEKLNQRIEKLNVEMQNLIKALDKTERKVGELMNDELSLIHI